MTDLTFKAQLDPDGLVIRVVPPYSDFNPALHRRLDCAATVLEGALSAPHEVNPFSRAGWQRDAWDFGRAAQKP